MSRRAFDDLAPPPTPRSPNPAIDQAIDTLMRKVNSEPADIAVKIVAQAINWEKVKNGIISDDSSFDPDDL